MKILVNTSKPCFITYYYEGYITKDISSNDDEYIEGKYCFEIKSYSDTGEDEISWLEEPSISNIKELEKQILKQFYEII